MSTLSQRPLHSVFVEGEYYFLRCRRRDRPAVIFFIVLGLMPNQFAPQIEDVVIFVLAVAMLVFCGSGRGLGDKRTRGLMD